MTSIALIIHFHPRYKCATELQPISTFFSSFRKKRVEAREFEEFSFQAKEGGGGRFRLRVADVTHTFHTTAIRKYQSE